MLLLAMMMSEVREERVTIVVECAGEVDVPSSRKSMISAFQDLETETEISSAGKKGNATTIEDILGS